MKFVDYYKLMGLEDTANEAEIKKAYRKLARKYHPDVSKEPDAEQRFKEIGEAYSVLKDPERKHEYDELKKSGGVQGHDFNPPPGWQNRSGFDPGGFTGHGSTQSGDFQFSDFYEQIFGNRSWQRTSQQSEGNFSARGQDLHTQLTISIRDAFQGSTLPVSLQVPVYHEDGRIATENKTLQIKIPKGVSNAQKIRLRGQGGPAVGNAPKGDLYIELSIADDEQYHLSGKDVTRTLALAPWEAALGASVDVPTLGGVVKLTVPANAKSGQRMRLKGRGMPGNPPGDQYVILTIVLPDATTDAQKELYRKMSSLWSFNPRTNTGD